MHTGHCLCGDIGFTVDAPLQGASACHCGQCRKSSGHFPAAVPVKWDDVDLSGDVRWYRSSDAARRGFCPTCGSYLFWEEFDGLVYLAAGALDGPTGLSLQDHIYYSNKGDYYAATDGLPCYGAGRSGPQVTA